MLRFFTFDQANIQPYRREFRYRRLWTGVTLALTSVAGVVTGAGAVRMWGTNWLGVVILGWISLWFWIVALICRSVLRARLRPSAWLVRVQADGLLIKFRSYLNYHFSSGDHTVVHIPFSDIEWIRQHQVHRTIPGSNSTDDATHRHRYVELRVSQAMAHDIEQHLSQERQRKGPVRPKWMGNGYSFSRHYPVQVIDGELVRIEWGVRPGIRQFLDAMQSHTSVQQPAATGIDFRKLDNVSREEQEQRLLELVETGNRMNAIQAARHLYKLNLTEAVRFIDELAGKEK